jgi:Mn2+/Fe2+ NRAMP family transporter
MSLRRRLLDILFWSVISAAFIGPGTLTTAAKAGADFGLPLLWALGFATLACLVLQEASSRLTIVSGLSLGEAISEQFPRRSGRGSMVIFVAVCILSGTIAYETGNLLGAMSGLSLMWNVAPWTFVLVTGTLAGIILYIPSLKTIARLMGTMVAFMGIVFLISAVLTRPSVPDVLRGLIRPMIPLNPGGGLLVLGLVGTTVVPYNLFLGSGISKGQNLREMRAGLSVAIILGGIISMAVLVTGTAVRGEFSFAALSASLDRMLGPAGPWILALGLFAAGFTSSITAPLASAVTMQSLFGRRRPGDWETGSTRFRLTWMIVLATGMAFGIAGFRPVPAIILAQALNGLILPVIGIFLLLAVNNPRLMKDRRSSIKANMLLALVVFVAIMLGLLGMIRSAVSAFGLDVQNWWILVMADALLSLILIAWTAARAGLFRRN